MINRDAIRAIMASMIERIGCGDAAAATINARWKFGASKGTVSKKVNGQLAFTIEDLLAIEDALKDYPMTRLLALRLREADGGVADCLIQQSGLIAKEAGEAVAAVIQAGNSASAQDKAQAIVEIDQAIDALKAARARLASGNT
jgi:hypothetical protein